MHRHCGGLHLLQVGWHGSGLKDTELCIIESVCMCSCVCTRVHAHAMLLDVIYINLFLPYFLRHSLDPEITSSARRAGRNQFVSAHLWLRLHSTWVLGI